MQKKWITPLLLLTLILTSGCAMPALPFLDAAPAANPAPTAVDADTLATLVADSVAQKVAQTLEALPPTALPTATATQTQLPTAIPTEIPATATATAIDYPETGSALLAEEDALVYYDYSGGYQLTTPANWLAIRPGEAEYTQVWGMPIASTPEVNNALQSMQSLDPNNFRLFILDVQDGHFDNGVLSTINLYSVPANDATLAEIVAQTVLELPETIIGLVVTDSRITQASNGMRMGVATAEWDVQLLVSGNVRMYQQQAIFLIKDRALVITLSSTLDFKDTILPDFKTLLDSLTSLN